MSKMIDGKRSKAMHKIHLRYGAVSASTRIVSEVKPMLTRLERGYFPTRNNADKLGDRLRELARVSPTEFTENSRVLLGV
jgi:hypothetical protein